MDILNKIRYLQRQRDWNESQLARAAGIRQSTISSLYRNNNLPTLPTLKALCGAFGITLSQFFSDESLSADLTDEQRKLLEEWMKLTDEQRKAVLHLIELM